MEVILGMLFLSLNNANVKFAELEKLTWKTYIVTEALPTTSQVKLIGKKKFAKIALNKNSETFVVYISALEVMAIYLSRAAQIATLQCDKALTIILIEYSDYADVFLTDLGMELSENNGINEHAIELMKGKQLPYGLIYAFNPVELETLKTYIKTYLKIVFIQPSKSPVGAPILFNKKLDDSLRLCINYQGFNNLTIKNIYLLPLIGEFLDRLG